MDTESRAISELGRKPVKSTKPCTYQTSKLLKINIKIYLNNRGERERESRVFSAILQYPGCFYKFDQVKFVEKDLSTSIKYLHQHNS